MLPPAFRGSTFPRRAPGAHSSLWAMAGLGAWKALTQWESAYAVVTLPSFHCADGDSAAPHALVGLAPGFSTSALLTFLVWLILLWRLILCAVGH